MARASRVDDLGGDVLEALRAGRSVALAAASAGLSEDTVRTWIKRGRLDRAGRFGPFAEAVDRRRRPALRVVEVDPDASLPDRDELLRRLDEQSRAGSTRATEILLRETGATPAARETADRLLGLVR